MKKKSRSIRYITTGLDIGGCYRVGCCVSTHFVLISMGCPRLVVIHKNKQLLLKKYFKKKPKNLSNLAISSNWLNFRGFWAFSQDRWVQSNFWLHSANLPIKVLWINTPHAYTLTNFFLHFSILYQNLYMQFRKWT